MISNCELPQTLPLSFILDRTQTSSTQNGGFHLTSTVGSHSFSINTTGQQHFFDTLPSIKTLVIKSRKRVSVTQLNTLLSDLRTLEELQLTDFDLNDIDSYAIETYDNTHSSSVLNEFHNVNHPKRMKRKSNDEHLINHNDDDNNRDSIIVTTMSTNEMSSSLTIPTTTTLTTEVLPLNIETTVNSNQNGGDNFSDLTTALPLPLPPLGRSLSIEDPFVVDPEDKIINETLITLMNAENDSRINSSSSLSMKTTTIKPMIPIATTIMSSDNPNNIEPDDMIINMTSSSTTIANENESINFEEDNINDVNIENRPIIMLDDNVFNFARILPNLKDLRLKNFIKESSIPNVMFQVIKGLDKLEFLELRSNHLEAIPANAFKFAGTALKKLYLSHNSIKHIDPNAFTNLSHLEILDISHNHLVHLNDYTFKPLKNLQFLTMYRNQFQNLSEYLFQSNKKLISLDISQNNQLEPLPAQLFNGLTSLSNLSLAHCNLTAISIDQRQFFRNVPNLLSLNMKRNQLKNLTLNGLFAWNTKLSKVDFSSNQIEQISADIFTINSTEIVELNLNKNQLSELPENLFIEARKIRKLSVSSNRLQQISPMTFMVLRELEQLDLSHNLITTINTIAANALPFGLGGYLRKIDLSYNQLFDFDSDIRQMNWNFYLHIAEINLRNNNFTGTLWVPNQMASLESQFRLDVSNNQFDSVNVQEILSTIPVTDRSQATVTKETLVRLDNNPLNCDCHLFPFLNYTKSVGRLYGKHFDTINRKIIFMIDANPKVTCHSPENLINRPLDNLKLSELICTIDDERICPKECDCNYRSSDRSAIIDCDNRNIYVIPDEINLSNYHNISLKDAGIAPSVQGVIFQLRENHIESVDNIDTMIKWNESDIDDKPIFVEILLDKNNISKLSWNRLNNKTIGSMVLLKKLSLQNNNLKQIPLSLLENFDALVQTNQTRRSPRTIKPRLFLGNNPIDCHNDPLPPGSDCYIREFKQWLSSHPSLIGDVNMIKCDRETIDTNSSSLVIVNMSDEHLCPVLIPPTSNTALMALSIICVILASSLFVVSVLYYRNKQTILAFIYIHLNPIFICLNFTEDDLDEEKIYDAFVSYSSSDRDVVMELIEKLEKPHDMNEVSLILQNGLSIHEGKVDQVVPENVFKKSATLKSTNKSSMDVENGTENNSYRLCIHERDWLPGNLISWNIVNSVQNSKRTILILSESFIRSIWFQVEFHTAYYQMLEDKMDRLIVIVRGNLPPKDELDKDLNFLLTTKTYLVWGEKWFWEKLYYAMPHKKNRPNMMKQDRTEKDKLTSVMSPTNTIKYNGTSLNGRLNGLNDNWSSSKSSNPKTEAMKQYVDKTIASHFQLNSYSPNSSIIADHHHLNNKQAAPQPPHVVNGISSSSSSSSTPNSNNINSRPAPKSLRNSGTLSTASPNTLKEFNNSNNNSNSNNNNGGIDNKSFIDETHT